MLQLTTKSPSTTTATNTSIALLWADVFVSPVLKVCLDGVKHVQVDALEHTYVDGVRRENDATPVRGVAGQGFLLLLGEVSRPVGHRHAADLAKCLLQDLPTKLIPANVLFCAGEHHVLRRRVAPDVAVLKRTGNQPQGLATAF